MAARAFPWLHRGGAPLGCKAQASPCREWSTGSRAQALDTAAHGLSYSEACEISLGQRSHPCLLHWQANSLPLSHQAHPRHLCFILHNSHFWSPELWKEEVQLPWLRCAMGKPEPWGRAVGWHSSLQSPLSPACEPF